MTAQSPRLVRIETGITEIKESLRTITAAVTGTADGSIPKRLELLEAKPEGGTDTVARGRLTTIESAISDLATVKAAAAKVAGLESKVTAVESATEGLAAVKTAAGKVAGLETKVNTLNSILEITE